MPPVQQQHTAKLQTAKLQTLHGLLVTPALPLSNSANPALLRGWLSDLLLVFAPLYSFSSFCALGCVCVFCFNCAEDENSLHVLQIEYVNFGYYDKHADESERAWA